MSAEEVHDGIVFESFDRFLEKLSQRFQFAWTSFFDGLLLLRSKRKES